MIFDLQSYKLSLNDLKENPKINGIEFKSCGYTFSGMSKFEFKKKFLSQGDMERHSHLEWNTFAALHVKQRWMLVQRYSYKS